MTAVEIVKLALVASICLIVASLGARTVTQDIAWLVRKPAKLLRAMSAIFLVVPAFAVWLCLTFPLDPAVKIAIIALAVSPIPPLLPRKQEKAGSRHAYAVSLLVCAAILSLCLTPLLVSLAGNAFGVDVAMSPIAIARTLAMSILVPLATGMVLKALAPARAERLSDFGFRAGMALLMVAALVMLAGTWRSMAALIGNGTVLAIAATVVLGLIAGHLLAGDGPDDRAALAIASASRHPGLAIAIVGANFAERSPAATAAILLFLLVNALVSIPYVRWIKGRAGAT